LSHRASEYFTIVIFGRVNGNSFCLAAFRNCRSLKQGSNAKSMRDYLKKEKSPKLKSLSNFFTAEQQQLEDQLKGSIEQLILGYTTQNA